MRPVFLYAMLSVGSLLGLASVTFILFASHQNARNALDSLGLGCLLEFGSVLYLLYVGIIRPRRVERQAQRDPQVISRKTMRISPTGVFVRHPFGEVTMHWPLIKDVVDNQGCIYFFLGKSNAIAVPKKAFDSPEAAQAFYDTAKQSWQGGKALATPNQEADPDIWPPAPCAVDSSQKLGDKP